MVEIKHSGTVSGFYEEGGGGDKWKMKWKDMINNKGHHFKISEKNNSHWRGSSRNFSERGVKYSLFRTYIVKQVN